MNPKNVGVEKDHREDPTPGRCHYFPTYTRPSVVCDPPHWYLFTPAPPVSCVRLHFFITEKAVNYMSEENILSEQAHGYLLSVLKGLQLPPTKGLHIAVTLPGGFFKKHVDGCDNGECETLLRVAGKSVYIFKKGEHTVGAVQSSPGDALTFTRQFGRGGVRFQPNGEAIFLPLAPGCVNTSGLSDGRTLHASVGASG